jgi:glycerate 2-kinase
MKIIKNRKELATSKLRKILLDLVEVGLHRVLPSTMMEYAVQFDEQKKLLTINNDTYDISEGRIFVVGGGKAAGDMAETLERILKPKNIKAGIVNCKDSNYKTKVIEVIEAGHPIPNEVGVQGMEKMFALRAKYSITEHDIVLCLISGGGSALMTSTFGEVTLNDKQDMTDLLLKCGADIHEINIVRKHLSRIKGGNLARFFAPAKVISLILSDVIGNDIDIIASGPTAPDKSTFSQAREILKKYKLLNKAPKTVRKHIDKGCAGVIGETAKELKNASNYIIGDNWFAIEAMNKKALEMGLRPYIISTTQIGDNNEVARNHAMEIKEGKYNDFNVLLIGGETTQKIPKNPGKGGRNQHFAGRSALEMEGYDRKWVMASVATDGSDYIKEAAGAIVDDSTIEIAKNKNINFKKYVDKHDCYTLFMKIGNSIIETGPTGTNVCDIMIYVLG